MYRKINKCIEITSNYCKIHTPCYVINKSQFLNNLETIKGSFKSEWGENILLGYSIKTNHLSKLMEIAKSENMAAEAVSDDEYYYAVEQRYRKEKIIFNGPQKSEECLKDALKNSSIINIDNLEEIKMISKIWKETKEESNRAVIGLRLNFDLEKECIGETTAGECGSRFGLSLENGEFETAIKNLQELGIRISGLHLHYSTRTRSLKVFEVLAKKACEVSKKYGLTHDIRYIDMGGGFWGGRALKGKPTMLEYSKVVCKGLMSEFNPDKVCLILEPGSSILATAVTFYSKVKNVRKVKNISIVTIDGSLLHFNPFLSIREPECKIYASGKQRIMKQIICGATCMENDRIIKIEDEVELKVGDYIQINNAGAYTVGFNNCFINLPPYVYLEDNRNLDLVRDKDRKLMFKI